jgi:hypothetical protein
MEQHKAMGCKNTIQRKNMKKLIFVIMLSVSCNSFADEQAELAKKLSNPVDNLISVPVDFILEEGIGPTGDGEATIINASPVLPFTLNDDWNLISRTVVSYVDQDDIPSPGMGESGFSDIAESVFFSSSAVFSCWILLPRMSWVRASGAWGQRCLA